MLVLKPRWSSSTENKSEQCIWFVLHAKWEGQNHEERNDPMSPHPLSDKIFPEYQAPSRLVVRRGKDLDTESHLKEVDDHHL